MSPTLEVQISYLERRLSFLQMLVRELVECRPAYLTLNLEQIHKHLFLQETLCERLRELERGFPEANGWFAAACRAQRDSKQGPASGARSEEHPPEARRLTQLLAENAAAEGEARRLNAVHGGLVRGTRATLAALHRNLESGQPTYSRPSRAVRPSAAQKAEC